MDYYTGYVFMALMRDILVESTLAAKKEFDHRCTVRGVKVKHYHANNGRFSEPAWINECKRCKQDLTYFVELEPITRTAYWNGRSGMLISFQGQCYCMQFDHRLFHLSYSIMFWLSKAGLLPKHFLRLKHRPPPCASCMFGAQHWKNWRTKSSKHGKKSELKIRKLDKTRRMCWNRPDDICTARINTARKRKFNSNKNTGMYSIRTHGRL